MSFFRKADVSKVARVETPDGQDWVELYAEFSKKQINQIILSSPKSSEDMQASLSFVERFFEIAVKDWSLVDEAGNKVPPTLDAYRDLAAEPSAWLDRVLVEHLQKTVGREVEDLEGKRSK